MKRWWIKYLLFLPLVFIVVSFVFFRMLVLTCPPKTDPKEVIGFSKNGGRKWQKDVDLRQNKSY